MSYTFIYILFFSSLTGLLLLLGSKTQAFAAFLKRKESLLNSDYHDELGTSEAQVVHQVDQVNKNMVGLWGNMKAQYLKVKLALNKYFQERRKEKLKKIQELRARQLDMMEKDEIVDSGQFSSASVVPKEQEESPTIQAQTVTPLNGSSIKDVEKKEVILINRIALDPTNKKHYRVLGDFYLKYGKIEDAKECFKHILKIDNRDDYALTQLERINEIR